MTKVRWPLWGRIMSRRLTLDLNPGGVFLPPVGAYKHGAFFTLDRDADHSVSYRESRWEAFMRMYGRPLLLWFLNRTLPGKEWRRYMQQVEY